MRALRVNAETTALTSIAPVPGLGFLPIGSFVIKGAQPVLVDCGMAPEADDFIEALAAIVDPADIRYIWLTHADRDHTGALMKMLDLAPHAKVVCQFVTAGIMGAGWEPIPPERTLLVRDGSTLDIGDRTLTAVRPPLFDSPSTLGLFDDKQRLMISSDFLGAPMPSEQEALSEDVSSIAEADVVAGQLLWGSVDAPWVHSTAEDLLTEALTRFASFEPQMVLSTHLPPIRGGLERHLETMLALRGSEPFLAPDQAALEAAMASIAH